MKSLNLRNVAKGLALVTVMASVSVASAQVTPRLLTRHYNSTMGMWFETRSANWGGYLSVDSTENNSAARGIGLERGDLIARVNGRRVQTADDLKNALRHAPRSVRLQVCDVRTRRWTNVWMTLNRGPNAPPGGNGNGNGNGPNNPPPPGGNPGGNNNPPMGTPNPRFLAGRWNTNLGASVQLRHTGANKLTGNISVPLFGTSEMRLAVNGQTGRIELAYFRLDGRDSGTGQLRMVNGNRLEGHYTNRHGIQVQLVLTR